MTFVDATELQRDTNKPTREVTLFLFNDKLMVTTQRHSGEDAAALWNEDNTIAQGSGMMKKETMKFKGWIDVSQVELFHGSQGNKTKKVKELLTFSQDSASASSFMIQTLNRPRSERRDSISSLALEKYFGKGPRLFSLPSDSTDSFRQAIQKTKALAKRYGKSEECKNEPSQLFAYYP